MGNLWVAVGVYLFTAGRAVDWLTLFGLVVGTGFVIGSACVLNNYLDRDMDARMKRTANRPSVTGALPVKIALPYAGLLFLLGTWALLGLVNSTTWWVGVIGAVWYVLVYGVAKRKTPHATLIGTVAGATPPLAGYTAATGMVDTVGWLFLALLVAWQMPHFYAIALFRAKEYAKAGVPVLSVVRGTTRTVWEMRAYTVLFIAILTQIYLATSLTGITYSVLLGLALWWLWQHWAQPIDRDKWARKVFKISLVLLPLYACLLALDPWLRSCP